MHDTNDYRSPVNIRCDAAAGKPQPVRRSAAESHLNFFTSESAKWFVLELTEAVPKNPHHWKKRRERACPRASY
jgi:hypothetical protein